jgi:hypothetical protein
MIISQEIGAAARQRRPLNQGTVWQQPYNVEAIEKM